MINTKKITMFIFSAAITLAVVGLVPKIAKAEPALPNITSFAVASTNCQPVTGLQIPKPCDSYSCPSGTTTNDCLKLNPLMQWVAFFINLTAALVGIGAVIMVIIAGLQYTAARDNPQGIQAAKQKLTNVLIGLAAFIFLWAFLQWLIPGGAF